MMKSVFRVEYDPLNEMYMLLFWGKDHQNVPSWMQLATGRKKDDLYNTARKFEKLKKEAEFFIIPDVDLPNATVQYVTEPE